MSAATARTITPTPTEAPTTTTVAVVRSTPRLVEGNRGLQYNIGFYGSGDLSL